MGTGIGMVESPSMRGWQLLVVTVGTCVLGCKRDGASETRAVDTARSDSAFFCRAMTPMRSEFYDYGECFPSALACQQLDGVECFEQPVAFCYTERFRIVGGETRTDVLCRSNMHSCTQWRARRHQDEKTQTTECELFTSQRFLALNTPLLK
jgi:hypothetical protein